MQIDQYEYLGPGKVWETPLTCGLNVSRKYGVTAVHLFDLAENEGGNIADYIWGLSRSIAHEVLMGESVDNIQWTLSSGENTTALKLSTINGEPFKLDISNPATLQLEKYGESFNKNKTLEAYQSRFENSEPRCSHFEKTPRSILPMTFSSKSIFCIPCNNPKAQDGVFYCDPSDSSPNSEHRTVMIADARALLGVLRNDDPQMIDHAIWKLSGSSAEEWLESTSIEHPRDLGFWPHSNERGLTFSSGQAALIKVIEDLGVPFVPITVEKRSARQLEEKVGYGALQGLSTAPAFNHQ